MEYGILIFTRVLFFNQLLDFDHFEALYFEDESTLQSYSNSFWLWLHVAKSIGSLKRLSRNRGMAHRLSH